jgi:Domain of Unknown Function (DUF928)
MKHINSVHPLGTLLLVVSSLGLATGNAQAISFTPPPNQGGAPGQSTGGASRGSVKFAPPKGQSAPLSSTGGASRGGFFNPPKDQGAPAQSTGGASRGQLFKPVKGRGTPLRAAGGASRVGRYDLNAAASNKPMVGPAALIAMLPATYSGTTVSAHPTLMAYLPASTAKAAIFSLKDEAGNMVYQQNLPVSGEAGLVAIALPANAPALEVNQSYQWYVALQIDGELNPSTPYVDGWIQRIEPTAAVAATLQQPDLLKQAEVLGANGVWYDCVAKLAAVRASQPDSKALNQQWQELLESVGLQDVAHVPLVAAVIK